MVDTLPEGAQVGLRVYGATVLNRTDKGACTDSQLVVPIGTANQSALKDRIADYRPYGETPISYSLKKAAADLGTSGKRTIMLVSDGEETCNADPCATAAALAKQGIDLKFDVIGLGVSGKARSQLQCIADKGNGTYYDADDSQQIEDALTKLATRAFRPFKLTGTLIEGTLKPAGAPTVPPGQYVDTFPGGEGVLHYRIPRSITGSTLYAGVTAEAAGFVPAFYMHLRTKGADGIECASEFGQDINVGGTRNLVTAEISSYKSDPKSACSIARELILDVSVSRETLSGAKFELLISEELPLRSSRHLVQREDVIDWQTMPSVGGAATKPPVAGTSISDAPTLMPGRYATSILTGEKQVFAVPLDWGQRLQVEVVVAPRTGALARALSVSDSLDLQLVSRMRGEYGDLSASRKPKNTNTMVATDEPYVAAQTTPTISYLNRTAYDSTRFAATPGPQYIVLNKSRVSSQGQFLVPFRMIVRVIGKAGTGAPDYVVPATPTPTATPSSTPTAGVSATPAPTTTLAGSGMSTGVVVGVALAAVIVGALGMAAVFALRRRRIED